MLILDLALSLSAAGLIARRGGRAGAFVLLGVALPGAALLCRFPEWMLQYKVADPPLAAALCAYLVAVAVGGAAGARLGARSPRLLALPLFAALTWNLAHGAEMLHVGTTAAFRAGAAPLLPGHFLAWLAACSVVSGVAFGVCWKPTTAIPGAP